MAFIFTLLFFCLGAIIASFVGVVTERVNTGTSWVTGRSRCDSCACELTPHDLIPILSWVCSCGRCRNCGSRVLWHSTLAEIVLGILFALAYLKLGLSYALFVFLFLLGALLASVLYDLRHLFVPRSFYLAVVVGGFVFAFLTAPTFSAFGVVLMVAVAIGVAFFLMFFLSGGRAMGLGDAPIAFGLALATGSAAVAGLMFSFWIGAVVGIALLVCVPRARRMGVEVPFVPFLAAGFLLAYFTTWDPFSIVAVLIGG